MTISQETIARTLAEHFAPELGAALTPLTERLLADEPLDEAITRSGELRVLLGYAQYVVRLSILAYDIHQRLMLERRTEVPQIAIPLLEALLAELRKTAPRDPRVPEHLRTRMMMSAADMALARVRPLPHATLLALHRAALASGFSDRRPLFAGIDPVFVASLPKAPSDAEQLLCDLDGLNAAGTLTDGSLPLARWLDNAVALAGPRQEAQVFAEARARLNA